MNAPLEVLLVDDEPALLQGLRRAAHREVGLTVRTAVGGPAALDALTDRPADVLVTDMRMPGMTGQQLLSAVRDRWPGTARLVLSGQADRRDTLAALPLAHQLLAKPCRWPDLSAAIGRAGRLRREVADDRLRAALGALGHLAVPATTRADLDHALSAGDVRGLAGLCAADVGLAAKVLQVANSPVIQQSQQLRDVTAAVAFLGPDLLGEVLGAGSPDDHGLPADEGPFSLSTLGRRALRSAGVDPTTPDPEHQTRIGEAIAELWGLPLAALPHLQEAG